MVPAFYHRAAGGAVKPPLHRGTEGGIEQHANRPDHRRGQCEAGILCDRAGNSRRQRATDHGTEAPAPGHAAAAARRERPAGEEVTRRPRCCRPNASGPGVRGGGGKAAYCHPDCQLGCADQRAYECRDSCGTAVGEHLRGRAGDSSGGFEPRDRRRAHKERDEGSGAGPPRTTQDRGTHGGRGYGAAPRQGTGHLTVRAGRPTPRGPR